MSVDRVTTTFPTMSEGYLEGSVINMSGQRSPYTKTRPKQGPRSDAPDSVGGARSQVAKDYDGPRCAPVTTIAYPNSPEASGTMRNVRLMPNRTGVSSDFWAARAG
jgi:hypothetical protein